MLQAVLKTSAVSSGGLQSAFSRRSVNRMASIRRIALKMQKLNSLPAQCARTQARNAATIRRMKAQPTDAA